MIGNMGFLNILYVKEGIMNNLKWLSAMNLGRTRRQMVNLLKNRGKRNRRGWTLVSILGLGTVLGTVLTRNANMFTPIQKFMRKSINVMPMKTNFANAEFANELTPETKQKKENTNQHQKDQI